MSILQEYLKQRVLVDENGCWLWQRALDGHGYGCHRFKTGQVTAKAHRSAFTEWNGPIPTGLHVLHRCGVSRCINPEHLYAGTQKENIHDTIRMGRHGHRGVRTPTAKLNDDKVREIRRYLLAGVSHRAIARLFGVGHNAIGRISRGQTWRHVA